MLWVTDCNCWQRLVRRTSDRLLQSDLPALPRCGQRGRLACFNRHLLGRLASLFFRCLNLYLVRTGRQRGSVRFAALQLGDLLSVNEDIGNGKGTELWGPLDGQLASACRGCRARDEKASKRSYNNGQNKF